MKNPTIDVRVESVVSEIRECVHPEVWCDQKNMRDLIICKKCNETIGIIHYARRDNDGGN